MILYWEVKISRIQSAQKKYKSRANFCTEESREQLAEVLAKGLKTEDTERTKSSCLERQLAAAEHMLQVRINHSCLKRQLAAADHVLQVRIKSSCLERQLAAAENMLQVRIKTAVWWDS